MMSPTGPNSLLRPAHPTRGFTLIELILVLGVLALGAAMAAPSLSRFSRSRQALDAAAHLLAVMQYAQNQAVSSASPYRLHLDTAASKYWLASRRDGVFARLATEFGRDFVLPQNTTASWDSGAETSARSYLEFQPDGSHDVASILLTAPDGEVTVIGCDSPSESFRITAGRGEGEPR